VRPEVDARVACGATARVLLMERGASVRVIMTHGAQEFITPLTLQVLSGNPVHTELLDEQADIIKREINMKSILSE